MTTRSMLDTAASPSPDDAFDVEPSPAAPCTNCPDHVPQKFWDAENGSIKVDDLSRSYSELERRLHQMGTEGRLVPGSADDYEIKTLEDYLTPDPDVNLRLHQAGFTQEQAQLVYDLAADRLVPLVQELAADTVAEGEQIKLSQHFGGKETWEHMAPQLSQWGRANLPEHVFDALSSNYQGVLAMHKMMQSDEPQMLSGGAAPQPGFSEADLKRLMEDPRYWRDNDPSVFKQVTEGFKRLYPTGD